MKAKLILQKLRLQIALCSLLTIEDCTKMIEAGKEVEKHAKIKKEQEEKYAQTLTELFQDVTETSELDITELCYHEEHY